MKENIPEFNPLQPAFVEAKGDLLSEELMNIVAIGASAGGLEALQRWFDSIPNDTDAAFVVIQHLSPDYKSIMDKLLERHTTMPVSVVDEAVDIEPNNIYLMSPGKEMALEGNKIVPIDRSSKTRLHLPINYFFRSIAQNVTYRSIGIILSGTGSDGCLGIKAIHETGGLVMVQSPDDSQFNGMPMNAIATGVVDLTAPIEELALTTVNYLKNPHVSGQTLASEMSDSNRLVQKICSLLMEDSGIDFSVYKLSSFSRRLKNRMNINQVASLTDYIRLLEDKPSNELIRLQQDLFIGVTEFFRDTEAFKSLREEVIEKLIAARETNEPIRIWCIACSSGEEAYTIAMICHDVMEQMGKQLDVKIFATDADVRGLDKAALGIYPESISTEIFEPLLSNHFVKETANSYRIRKHIRNMVVFAKHDILKDPPFSNIDLVTCRNMLIYFQPVGQQKAFNSISFSLAQGGHLFLGKAETPFQSDNVFECVDYRGKIYKKINASTEKVKMTNQNTQFLANNDKEKPKTPTKFVQRSQANNKIILLSQVAELIFDRFLPATVIADKHLEVIHSYGHISDWLLPHKPGRTSDKITDLFTPSISSYILSAIDQCNTTKKEVIYRDLEESQSGDKRFTVRVIPYHHYDKPNSDADVFHIVTLMDTTTELSVISTEDNSLLLPADEAEKKRLEFLENEVKELRARLGTSQAQLSNASEQLQTSNEELMASNEELQGTNEELQAVNEELYTLNSEYQQKINELTVATNDIDNFMKSTGIAAIFLDKSYRIRRYTAPFGDYINILPVDVNRSFLDLKLSFGFESIEKYLAQCALKGTTHTRKIILPNGHEGALKILPYLNSKRKVDGVVLMIDEINEIGTE
ncbi:CheR family methyltransferase [Leucothrix arctica]|uniref:protein-glutamate O-methyltransferase n=1 Tax=Leucothrix arctica TaxID=1481894 RepID=A0A317CG77_9GAMM|nr:CheR family methyltransferase [Leucothrix arctica]PWQ96413.1 hypothetical protein DKT75_10560 [Leucothrix arctica]